MEKHKSQRTCFQRFKDAVSLVPQDATPPNWDILWLIFISLFSSAFTLTFLFPFLPEVIKSFGYSEEDKGTYVGLIASSVFAGRAVGSFFWGWLADLKGRRLVLLITILFNGLFSFLFGFAKSLAFAMVLRFLAGLANGTVGVAKTVLYDVSDNTNQAFSMSIISIAWGSGLILGPTIGGYIALPATKYPSVFSDDGFFADFPFVLPSFCCLIVCSVVFVIVFCKFQEPKVLLNTEYGVKASTGSDKAPDSAGEDGRAVCSTHTLQASHPLLDRLKAGSASSVPSKVQLSMETHHCESELSYYYAQLENLKSSRRDLSEDVAVSKSMHNLSPVTLQNEDLDLLPIARRRSYSHGHKAEVEALKGINEFQTVPPVSTSKTNGEAEPVAQSIDIHVVGPEKATAIADACETNSRVKGGLSAACANSKDHVAVTLNDEGKEIDDISAKSGSKESSCWDSIRQSALIKLLSDSGVRHSVALYTIMSFAIIGYEDVFTVFASTAVEYDGLGFSTDEIGIALGAVSIPLLLIQIKIYPLLVAKFGIKRVYVICVFFLFIPIQLVPMVHMLVDNKVWLWVCLVGLTLPFRVAGNSCFTGSSLLINNSVTSDMAGKANGIGMTATAIARTLAPTLGGALFSWSLRMNATVGSPVDVNLTFVFFGFVLFISALQCVFLPEHLDHQKK